MSHATMLRFFVLSAVLCISLASFVSIANAQVDDPAAMKARAMDLLKAQRMTEALPLFEKLAVSLPKDPEVQLNLGFSLLGQAANTADANERRQLRIRARNAFVKSKDLGNETALVQGLIDGLPLDGGDAVGFSDNAQAEKLMKRGEAAFSSGQLDEAFTAYQGALKIDPRCYFAAVFAGDVHTQKGNFPEALVWYQKAIDIDPNIETAYRYSATPLMKQKKYDEARDRYVEAFIVAPYSKLAISGIIQWGQTTSTQLGHPKIDIPEIKYDANGKPSTVMNENSLTDGSKAWLAYSLTRDAWHKEKFSRTFPNEKQYRHTLLEEAEALRSVLKMAKEQNLSHPQFTILQKLDNDGVLEAFILMAIPDQGIAQDHRAYLSAHRDKLRQYVVNYVVGGAK